MGNKLRLKDVLRQVKQELWEDHGIPLLSESVAFGKNYARVTLSTPQHKALLTIKVDCSQIDSGAKAIIDTLYNVILFIESNWLQLSVEEIEFLTMLRECQDGAKLFHGDVSNVAYNLHIIGAIHIETVDEGWYALLSEKGRIALEELLYINL